jgi:hypothetical protein
MSPGYLGSTDGETSLLGCADEQGLLFQKYWFSCMLGTRPANCSNFLSNIPWTRRDLTINQYFLNMSFQHDCIITISRLPLVRHRCLHYHRLSRRYFSIPGRGNYNRMGQHHLADWSRGNWCIR